MSVLFWFSDDAWAADKFGQTVPHQLEQTVAEARKLRLPYLREMYNPKKSVELLEGVIKRKPDYFRAYFNLGLAYHELGDYEKAKMAFDKALEIRAAENLNDFSVVNTAGWVSMNHGDFERAEKLLKEAERLAQGSGTFTEGATQGNLGELYYLTQDFDKSKQYFIRSRDEYDNQSAQFYLDQIDAIEKKKKVN
ncbi:MAG: tetratricopeptide repeat protein [Hyphomicrobiales bacterium]